MTFQINKRENYNINNDLINNGHILSKESNKVDKTKLNIIQRLIDLKYNLKNFNLKNFETFFKNLQTKITIYIIGVISTIEYFFITTIFFAYNVDSTFHY